MSPHNTTQIACPHCGADHHSIEPTADFNMIGVSSLTESLSIPARCQNCGTDISVTYTITTTTATEKRVSQTDSSATE